MPSKSPRPVPEVRSRSWSTASSESEDRSSSLVRSRPLLKNMLTNAPSVSSQHFDCHRHLPRSILVAQVTWLLQTCYPSAHIRMCYPSAHSECAIQVHGITRAPISCTTRNHALLSCTPPTRAPLILVHYSCTVTYSRAPLCNLVHHYVLSCTTCTPAPLILLHYSCTLCNLVHYSCTTTYSHTPLR